MFSPVDSRNPSWISTVLSDDFPPSPSPSQSNHQTAKLSLSILHGPGGINLLQDSNDCYLPSAIFSSSFAPSAPHYHPAPSSTFFDHPTTTTACPKTPELARAKSPSLTPTSVFVSLASSIPPPLPQPQQSVLSSQPNANTDLMPKMKRRGMYQCQWEGCTKEFKKPCLLKSHYYTHNMIRPYACTLCSSAFIRNHDLKRHERSVHGVGLSTSASCKYCGKHFTRVDSCKYHEATSCSFAVEKSPFSDS